jgi:hypothetical protein
VDILIGLAGRHSREGFQGGILHDGNLIPLQIPIADDQHVGHACPDQASAQPGNDLPDRLAVEPISLPAAQIRGPAVRVLRPVPELQQIEHVQLAVRRFVAQRFELIGSW